MQDITDKLEQVQQQVTDLVDAVNKAKPNYIVKSALSLYSPINIGRGPKLMVAVYESSDSSPEVIAIEEFPQYCGNIIKKYKHKRNYIISKELIQSLQNACRCLVQEV